MFPIVFFRKSETPESLAKKDRVSELTLIPLTLVDIIAHSLLLLIVPIGKVFGFETEKLDAVAGLNRYRGTGAAVIWAATLATAIVVFNAGCPILLSIFLTCAVNVSFHMAYNLFFGTGEPANSPLIATKAEANPPDAHAQVREQLEKLQLIDFDNHLLVTEGTHYRLYQKMGAHVVKVDGQTLGVHFAVWAPNAQEVGLVGDFNGWKPAQRFMFERHPNGVWTLYVPGMSHGELYKYSVKGRDGVTREKSDPFAFSNQFPTKDNPDAKTSIISDISYEWGDTEWMENRERTQALDKPISIYELQIGSWMRGEGNRWLTYRELAPKLAAYIREMGFTHVELMPVNEYYSEESWGYQVNNYYAPSSRFGTPQDFMYLVDYLHKNGIGVIMDWMPAHFPKDEAGLVYFDGTHLYSYPDALEREHPDWGDWKTNTFNYARHEVRSFVISNALFWLDKYHVDGIRIDAVSSILYRNSSRRPGDWVPHAKADRESLEAIAFLVDLNREISEQYRGVITAAEVSTEWSDVTAPLEEGGLGFSFKWAMQWMNDTLRFLSLEPNRRDREHNSLTYYVVVYAFLEKYVLPLSHDVVVRQRKSLKERMPGNEQEAFANLRLLYANQYAMPGKPLMFMGDEFGQVREWDHTTSIDWQLLNSEVHLELQNWVKALNAFYRRSPGLYERDSESYGKGFEWIDREDVENSVICFIRRGKDPQDDVIVVLNHKPVVLNGYRIGIPDGGRWEEVLNSDSPEFGGSGVTNGKPIPAEEIGWHDRPRSLALTLPPLGAVFLKKVN